MVANDTQDAQPIFAEDKPGQTNGMSRKGPDEFEVLNSKEAAAIRENASQTGRRPFSPVTKALLAGETVFLVGRQSYNTKTFTALGKRLRSNRAERNGRAGVYIWLEDAAK